MAYTLAQLDAVERAITSGTVKVRYADKEVTYHSLAELRELRNEMRAELLAAGVLTSGPSRGAASVLEFGRD